MELQEIKKFIRDIKDFPSKGIIFRDITPLLANPQAFKTAVEAMAEKYKNTDIDYVAAIDARGFIFGAALALELDAGLVPVRKKDKLPFETLSCDYSLEYGENEIEMHIDAVKAGDKVLVVDDLLATGGTLKAACSLIERLNASVAGVSVLIELTGLEGRNKLTDWDVNAVVKY